MEIGPMMNGSSDFDIVPIILNGGSPRKDAGEMPALRVAARH
jgi:hypothetical protein